MNKKDILILVIPLLIVGIAYFMLPSQIPRQFGFNGEVRYGGKEIILLFGFLPFLIYKKNQKKNR